MINFLATAKDFIAQVMALGWWMTLGALIAFFAAVFRPWVGYPGVAIGGAVVMFLALWSGWLGGDSDKVKRLEAELEARKAELAIERETNDVLAASLAEEAEIAEHNAGILADLYGQIDKLEDRPDCALPKEFSDELKKLR